MIHLGLESVPGLTTFHFWNAVVCSLVVVMFPFSCWICFITRNHQIVTIYKKLWNKHENVPLHPWLYFYNHKLLLLQFPDDLLHKSKEKNEFEENWKCVNKLMTYENAFDRIAWTNTWLNLKKKIPVEYVDSNTKSVTTILGKKHLTIE